MLLQVLATAFAIGISWVVVTVLRNRATIARLKKLLPHFDAVPSLPVLGTSYHFKDPSPEGIFATFSGFHRLYGRNLFTEGLFNQPAIQITDPKVIEQVVQARTIEKTIIYDFMVPWLGTGLVTSAGAKWAQRRKIITPTFHFKILEDFLVIMNHQADVFIDKLTAHAGGPNFDVYEYVTYCALDIISESAMGVKLNTQQHPNAEYVQAVKEFLDLVHKRIFNPLMRSNIIYSWTEAGQRQKKLESVLNNFMDTVMQERKHSLINNAAHESNGKNHSIKTTFLDLLLQTRHDDEPLPDKEIRGEVNTFMFAGHETITSCVSFALYYLSRNPNIQQKVYSEIVSVYGAEGNVRSATITLPSLQQLKYMDMVIKETLRISPSVPFIGRSSAGDMTVDGVVIPAETEVLINIYIMHNDPDQYPEPDRFLPERFEDEDGKTSFSYLPFSAGIRSCVGQRFAMLEMKTILVKLLANYRMLPCKQENELQFKSDLTLKPSKGAFIQILER
ncbi:AGAP013305-PA-like protein [Anopheles sinensis]|uniref:AGAP013305-PA-like protein n=1 Tax=Anopheles sinensis TaxID=74873 RepID=A0A084VRT3_ANOSI|nr:AGAP013305-PA-like protein [Anopheles sinensis]